MHENESYCSNSYISHSLENKNSISRFNYQKKLVVVVIYRYLNVISFKGIFVAKIVSFLYIQFTCRYKLPCPYFFFKYIRINVVYPIRSIRSKNFNFYWKLVYNKGTTINVQLHNVIRRLDGSYQYIFISLYC